MEHIINRILVTKAGLEALSIRLPIGIILAAASCAITLLVALVVVHLGKGFFLATQGIEHALALVSATTALSIMSGSYSRGRYLVSLFFGAK